MSAQPSWPLPVEPDQWLPRFIPRSRREIQSRDNINALQFEHWQTDGRYGVYDRRNLNERVKIEDTQPINSRFVERQYRTQPRLENDSGKLGMNPYFDKYDVAYDGMNAVRELRSAVYENKITDGLKESSKLLQRNLDNRWLPEGEAQRTAGLGRIMSELRPKMDDMRIFYK